VRIADHVDLSRVVDRHRFALYKSRLLELAGKAVRNWQICTVSKTNTPSILTGNLRNPVSPPAMLRLLHGIYDSMSGIIQYNI
jgi:hypothetical protein